MKTPLFAWHTQHGAVLSDDRGVELPERFAEPLAEYHAVRETVGLIDLSFRTQVRMTGEDRVSFLQGMVSNDVKALMPGRGCPATFLTEQGRIVADLRIYALETALLLDMDARIQEKTTEALSHFIIADDVEMEDLSAQQTTLSLQGPAAARVLTTVGVSLDIPEPLQHKEVDLTGVPVRLVHVSDTGEDGYEMLIPTEQAEHVWQVLLKAGESFGIRPVGLAALHMLRVEAGIPWYGLDMDEKRLVLEVGLDRVISFKKGCYLGQEVVERASARGHVNRKLSGLVIQSETLPESGAKVFYDSQEVGWLTSVAHSPRFQQPIALAYIRREHLTPGTQLRIDSDGTPVIAEVTTLPFSR
ncbi:MAG: aminomethyltransferase family protein [Candidatus Binatia bacterium]